jgi:hypothetical protein
MARQRRLGKLGEQLLGGPAAMPFGRGAAAFTVTKLGQKPLRQE